MGKKKKKAVKKKVVRKAKKRKQRRAVRTSPRKTLQNLASWAISQWGDLCGPEPQQKTLGVVPTLPPSQVQSMFSQMQHPPLADPARLKRERRAAFGEIVCKITGVDPQSKGILEVGIAILAMHPSYDNWEPVSQEMMGTWIVENKGGRILKEGDTVIQFAEEEDAFLVAVRLNQNEVQAITSYKMGKEVTENLATVEFRIA